MAKKPAEKLVRYGSLELPAAQPLSDEVKAMPDAEAERHAVADPAAGSVRAAAVEKWLTGEVVPTLEAIKADPSRLLSAEEAWHRLQDMRDAVQEGLESGAPVPFDLQDILTEAKARKERLRRDINAAFDDPRPSISDEEVSARLNRKH